MLYGSFFIQAPARHLVLVNIFLFLKDFVSGRGYYKYLRSHLQLRHYCYFTLHGGASVPRKHPTCLCADAHVEYVFAGRLHDCTVFSELVRVVIRPLLSLCVCTVCA